MPLRLVLLLLLGLRSNIKLQPQLHGPLPQAVLYRNCNPNPQPNPNCTTRYRRWFCTPIKLRPLLQLWQGAILSV